MEIKIVNTAAGIAISNHGKQVSRQKLIRYQVSLSVLDAMLRNGERSKQAHEIAGAVLASHYGIDQGSIFR